MKENMKIISEKILSGGKYNGKIYGNIYNLKSFSWWIYVGAAISIGEKKGIVSFKKFLMKFGQNENSFFHIERVRDFINPIIENEIIESNLQKYTDKSLWIPFNIIQSDLQMSQSEWSKVRHYISSNLFIGYYKPDSILMFEDSKI